MNRPPADETARNEIQTWLLAYEDAIRDEEAQYLDVYDDLIGIEVKEKSWTRKVVESLEWALFRIFPVIKRRPGRDLKTGEVAFLDYRGFETVAVPIFWVFSAVSGLFMLIGPLWILYKVSKTEAQLGVITGFITLFFVLVLIGTRGKMFESLAAAAAYAAVLMVFLTMGNTKS
jgi:hypothetical protein